MAIEFVMILYNWNLGCLVTKMDFPSLNITGDSTTITSAHLRNEISKIWISSDKNFAALCIIIKLKPDIIINIIDTVVSERFFIFLTKHQELDNLVYHLHDNFQLNNLIHLSNFVTALTFHLFEKFFPRLISSHLY